MQVARDGDDSFTAMNRRILSWIPALLLAAPLAAAPPATPAAPPTPIPPPADVAAAPADAQVTSSGLASKVLTPGTGTEHPGPAAPSASTTRAGRPTARCSTPRSSGELRPPSS